MRQRWWLNLALLVVILILVALIFYTIEQEKPEELPPLTDLAAEKVQNLQIERADKEPILLMKDALGFWQMMAPVNLPAKNFHIDRLLQILSARDYKLLDADDKLNLAEFNLEPPLASIKFNQLTVAFGNSSPIDYGQRYLLINQKVYLLTDSVYYLLNDDALTFASLSPLGNKPKMTELKMPNYHLVLTEGKWTLTTTFSSDDIDTSADALSGLINNWQQASAFNIEPYDANSPAQGEIDITLLGVEQPLHFTIVSTTPDLVLALPEKAVQYQFPVSQADKLLHLPTKKPAADATTSSENKTD